MSYTGRNPNGQATSANSEPVVIASDQSVLPVNGSVASGATDSGNPIKIGGKYNSTQPTLTDGQRGDAQLTSRGAIKATLFLNDSLTTFAPRADNADGVAASGTANNLGVLTRNSVFNGTTWDRMYGTTSGLYSIVRDAAGNARGANVDSSNNLMVNVAGGIAPVGTVLNTYSIHLTANATTTPTSSTAYISSVTISNEVGGTTSTITIQDKQGTPLKLINGVATTALTTAPTVVNFQTPVKMVSGIDIITAGAVAATVDVWINYYQ